MSVCPRSLLLGLLVILYLQACVEGQHREAPESCCFKFFNSPIPVADITEYKETGADCPNPGVIFTTAKGRVCAEPSSWWVKRAMGIIDQQRFKLT